MTLILSGTDGLSDVDGTAATPAIRGTDTNTGIFFPAADTIAFSEGGVEAMRLDSSGNVGIGTSSPTAITGYRSVTANGSTSGLFSVQVNGTDSGYIYADTTAFYLDSKAATPNLVLRINGSERARIDSSGNLLVGTTSQITGGGAGSGIELNSAGYINTKRNSTAVAAHMQFANPNGFVGSILTSGSSTSYGTSSDYRLKEQVQPMTGALAKVAALKPCTYKWKVDGSDGEGFIAHELQAVCPDAVTGEKDAVDAEGKPIYQGIDTSFLVATLTAAIQEQQAIIQSLTARIEALEGK